MKADDINKYKSFPFWSWNDELDEKELTDQIQWMHDNGIGGFFMHARGGLTTPYLGEKWFSCIEACLKKAKELNMEAYAYDENGWPSGFVGGLLLKDDSNKDAYLTTSIGKYDSKSLASYDISGDKVKRVFAGDNVFNIYFNLSTSTADICNKEVVDKFIKLTHEQYKKHDIYGNLKGFFTDEPQYYRWGTPYTRVLPNYFKKHYKEDILDRLALLFLEKEGYRDFRYKYWKAMQDLMLNAFAKNVYKWCDKNGYKLTGHYVEERNIGHQIMCNGGIMPFYEYEHIPGCDWLGRGIIPDLITSKQVGSVSAQLGKKQTMSEMFACAGWDVTPLELKHIAEHLYVGGVNITCQHLLPFHEHGQRKRDYPAHYSSINPWTNTDAFLKFNDYFTTLGEKLSKSKEIVNVGVIVPVRSAYFNYKRDLEAQGFGVKDIDESYYNAVNLFNDNQIPYHLIDETILKEHGKVKGSKLIVGLCTYEYLVFPKIFLTMDTYTERLIKKYVKNGGKVLLLGNKPTYLEGKEFDYSYLNTNTSLDEIKDSQPFVCSSNKNIRSTYRVDENNNPFIYLVNVGEEKEKINVKYLNSSNLKINNKICANKLTLDKYESLIIEPSDEEISKVKKMNSLILGDEFTVKEYKDNYLTIDNVSYSFDNKTYSPFMNVMGAFNLLLNKRYKGDLYLKYIFNIKNVPNKLEALIEDTNTKSVYINGVKVKENGFVLEKYLRKYDISKNLKKGKNEIIVIINFFEKDNVYYALFGKNVTESLKNCLAYDTTIESIYLRGDFGVEAKFKDGKRDGIYLADSFAISKPKNKITNLVKDGYPFYRGEITLEQNVKVDSTNYMLEINRRFQVIDLFVNDQFVDKLMFTNKVDISKYLIKGNNKITLKLIVSNRNLLGPHHTNGQEEFVGPYSFERMGTWNEKGQSPHCLSDYAFIDPFFKV